jgi:hypothetical protein
MNAGVNADNNKENPLWHVTVDLAFDGYGNETCQDQVNRLNRVLNSIRRNGSGLKDICIMKLPSYT